jgi:hypothetical protein
MVPTLGEGCTSLRRRVPGTVTVRFPPSLSCSLRMADMSSSCLRPDPTSANHDGPRQGFPVSASSTRTAVAESSGARTQMAGVVAATMIVLVLVRGSTSVCRA